MEPPSACHSEEILQRKDLGNEPVYKTPRVSAVPGFPSGCGPFASSVGTGMTAAKKYPPRRAVSAVRDFPSGCGPFASSVGTGMTAAKKHPPQRTVYCARDFPPQCGINASPGAKAYDQAKMEVQDKELHNSGPSNMMERPGEKSVDMFDLDKYLYEEDVKSSKLKLNRVTPSLKPASRLSWLKGKVAHKSKPGGGMSGLQRERPGLKFQSERSEDAWRTKVSSEIGGHSLKKILSIPAKTTGSGQPSSSHNLHDNDTQAIRKEVTETLGRFKDLCRQLESDKSKVGVTSFRRVDFQAAKILKKEGRYVNTCKQVLGHVPGVETGDEFHYRIELNIVGLHHPTQAGIDYAQFGGKILATSIVASGGYADDLHDLHSLTYTGQGGNEMCLDREAEDQKLERGNLALNNSKCAKTPVRVIRGSESSDGRSRKYVYDGLYMVVKSWKEKGTRGKLVFKFQLDRIEGQSLLQKK